MFEYDDTGIRDRKLRCKWLRTFLLMFYGAVCAYPVGNYTELRDKDPPGKVSRNSPMRMGNIAHSAARRRPGPYP